MLCGFTAILAFVLVVVPGVNSLWYIYVIRFIILFSSIIPISLRINLDLAKAFYAREIWKTSMAEKDEIVAQSPEIAEEIGRIQYLFSDKTGTLTRNGSTLFFIFLFFYDYHIRLISFSFDEDRNGDEKSTFRYSGLQSRYI